MEKCQLRAMAGQHSPKQGPKQSPQQSPEQSQSVPSRLSFQLVSKLGAASAGEAQLDAETAGQKQALCKCGGDIGNFERLLILLRGSKIF